MRGRVNLLLAFLVLAAGIVAGCASSSTGSKIESAASPSAEATKTVVSADGAKGTAALAAAPPGSVDYQISARDILDVTVFQVPDLSKTVQVSEDGYISLPLLGKVRVRGSTTAGAEEEIAAKLRKSYLQSPQVSVIIRQYGQRVTISGEVKTPKVMSIDGRVTLTEAIANAGGFGDLADSKRVHIARTVNERIQDTVYDFDAIQAGQIPDPALQGGDLIVAEQSGVKVALKNLKDLLPFAIFAPLL